jgi:tRNA1Val (adenine37-N6)-methyltransferase
LVDKHRPATGIDTDVSIDSLFDGRLICMQPSRGYRYSIDSLLLADFAAVEDDDNILDLGCGCGIIGLIMFFRLKANIKKITGLELQHDLAELAKRNAELNGYSSRYTVVNGDLKVIKTLFAAESFTSVVCNPPFYTSSSGRKNADRQSLIARHQVCSTTNQVMAACSYVVKNRGNVSIVFPAEGMVELVCAMEKSKLQPKRMQVVYSYPEKEATAKLVLIEAVKNGGVGMKIQPPLYIFEKKNGTYSAEMQQIYGLQAE